MWQILKASFIAGASIGGVGTILGGLAGWFSILQSSKTPDEVGQLCAGWHFALIALAPLGLFFIAFAFENDLSDLNEAYPRALTVNLLGGLIGAVASYYLFILMATIIAGGFGNQDSYQVFQALFSKISILQMLLVIASTLLIAPLVALWSNRRANQI